MTNEGAELQSEDPDDARIAKWAAQLETISEQIVRLNHHRRLWQEMMDAIAASDVDDGGYFASHYTRLYIDGAVMTVRRLADAHGQRDTISLGRLLQDIFDHPNVLTLSRVVTLYQRGHEDDMDFYRDQATADWEPWSGDGEAMNADRVVSDLHELAEVVARIKAFADRTVAHIDSRGVEEMSTFDDLDQSIDRLGELFRSYSLPITGKGWVFLDPAIQGDWKAPFRKPLFESDQPIWGRPTPPGVPEPGGDSTDSA